ncbi:HIRAN domain-containing protein [Paenimyroides aestuarii]|uniref:HIRAN domain-containing protein n=1 Tax=Paenimyroides aestuarii TaxID=2968490 RepID=A0ABY5NNS5_9FLAO|nr:HIRAN domain-containing protein [Paenimyroides aestuarii]UUV20211.1 HIRAN domain-containing protein [Paenimyroides aestuarii]
MKRSDFLKSLGLGFGGIILPQTSFFETKKVKIYDNYIRGLQFYKFTEISKAIKEGDEVFLKRDTENLHDSFAIEVYFQHVKLGYIAAYENIVLANMLDQHIHLAAKVSKLDLKSSFKQIAIMVFADLVVPTDKLIVMMNQELRADDTIDLYRNNL